MLAKDLISTDIPPLKVSDTAQKALEWMDEFKVSHLPVIEKTHYVGIISDAEIFDHISANEPISKIKRSLSKPFVFEDAHAYDVLKMYALLKISVIPVIDAKEHFVGAVTSQKMLDYFSQLTAAQEPGSLIVLELHQRDYSLSQIAQIAESNGAKILSLFLTPRANSTELDVTIKLSVNDVSAVLQTFERFSYTVKASFSQSVQNTAIKDRYDALMHYLNI
ncbi:MAG TPA: CBS domain-containing protein [Bacteroidia bacterium]|jgi:acetoin utilization protein AcuB|nr:CBS domain-containing protein [Bacteroidia bacterium]HWY99120.1 CBS domain-containing protein [Bacteroidia bacterium]